MHKMSEKGKKLIEGSKMWQLINKKKEQNNTIATGATSINTFPEG